MPDHCFSTENCYHSAISIARRSDVLKISGLQHLIHAVRWSLGGLRAALRDEAAFRQELVLVVLLAPLGVWVGQSAVERVLLVGSLVLVLVVELLNTAIEAAVDRIGKDRHPLSKKAKDAASAAVMLAILHAALVWGMILLS